MLMAALVVTLNGCQFKGPAAVGGGDASDVWRPRAESLRIYPSTRFIESDGQTLLQARVELRDQMGDAIKAAGTLRFDLFASSASGEALGERLYHWGVDMITLADQKAHFDSVTRTYQYRLRLDDATASQQPTVLRVTFNRASDGKRLQGQAPLGSE